MRRDESVFFFTLVDFLVTTLFFGLMLVAVSQARASEEKGAAKKNAIAVDTLKKLTGISDLTELTDRLTRLGPLKSAEQALSEVKKAGGMREAHRALELVAKAGGADTVTARLLRLSAREGAGKPHCIFTESLGIKEAKVLASVVANDSTIDFRGTTPELEAVLASLGTQFAQVRSLRFADFRRGFERLRAVQPDCMYTLDFTERTRYVDARDAVRGIFYTRIHR